MPDRVRIERGLALEDQVAASIGGRKRPGSGNRWEAQGDVAVGPLLISCKASTDRTWSQTKRELLEAIEMALSTGLIPVLDVLDDDGLELTIMRRSDFVALLTEGCSIQAPESNGERRGRLVSTPAALRNPDA
jgi:hypothetical protein